MTQVLLDKSRPVVAVGGGALCFAVFHGVDIAFPEVFATGLVAGEIFRRSGSVWPAVVVHGIVNLPTFLVLAI